MRRESWMQEYRKGLRFLSRRRTLDAVRAFRTAVDLCPVTQRRDLSRILYYLALSLEHAGSGGLAIRSLADARSLDRRGYARKMHDRWVNEYGMRRQRDVDGDDFCAFFSIQTKRYLSKRGGGRFGSDAERDAVSDLIKDAWVRLSRSGILRNVPADRKLALFRRAKVDLPFLYLEDAFDEARGPIAVDFRRGKAVGDGDRCPCGSGLPYIACCGRIPASCELDSGSF